jgi:putative peptidoglycan lipid II flippase
LLGGIFFRFTTIFEKIIASNLSKGSISYLGYSSQIITVLGTITSNGISIVIFPLLSKHWSNNNSNLIKHYIRKSLRIILLLTIPISIYLLFFGNFIISKTFQRGAFSLETTVSVSRALKFSLGAFIFQSIGSIIVKLFYISGYTKVNTIISSIELVVYIILSYLLVNTYSYIGLPIALTISSGLSIAASIYYLNHKIILIGYINILKDIFLIFSLSLISILFIYLINKNIYIYNDILTISISTIIGVLIFFIIGINIKIEELNVIQKFLFRKFQKLQDES